VFITSREGLAIDGPSHVTEKIKLSIHDARLTSLACVTFGIYLHDIEIGFVALDYYSDVKEMTIGDIDIASQFRRDGVGRKVYEAIPHVPSIESHSDFRFMSGDLNEATRGVWRGLVRDGLARKHHTGRYEMLSTPRTFVDGY
jgi:hypothetical protein